MSTQAKRYRLAVCDMTCAVNSAMWNVDQRCRIGFKNLSFFEVFKNKKTSKVRNLVFFSLIYSKPNLTKMIFKYENAICGVHIAESLDLSLLFIEPIGRNFVSSICKLIPK